MLPFLAVGQACLHDLESMMIPSESVAGETFLSHMERLFTLSLADLRAMTTDFHEEMRKGLSGGESSLKMLPSYVDRAKGNEKGDVMALDLGGTHVRVLTVRLDGEGGARILHIRTFALHKAQMQGTGEDLFDFIAECIDGFLTENGLDRTRTYDLAFTFSFPVQQTGIAAGVLIEWTKGFTATGVRGRDVVGLLNDALRRKQIQCIRVTALVNDTVGTLVAGSYGDPTCDLGVILGTGTNACYREQVANIKKLQGLAKQDHMIVNMEWGNFDKVCGTGYDRELDASSVNPGAMHLEKMVSGMYLGELTRGVVADAIQREALFRNAPEAALFFKRKDLFDTSHMSLIEGDETPDLGLADGFLKQKGIQGSVLKDRVFLKRLCGLVSARAACLSAAAVAAVIAWMDPHLAHQHTVAMDGSLFEKYPGFSAKMRSMVRDLHGVQAENIAWVHSKDGSGRGAAIVAAVAASEKNKEKIQAGVD